MSLPGLVEGEAAAHHLQAEVVLLVDHHADRFLGVERDAARAVEHGREFPADELPLDQELAVERGQSTARRGSRACTAGRPWRWRPSRRASISAFCGSVARLVNGKSARLRARRMRVDTTTSDSGPVPRSHSPRFGSRLSRFIRWFLRLPSGGSGRGAGRPVRSPRPRRRTSCCRCSSSSSAARRAEQRPLAGVRSRPVDALQERFEHLRGRRRSRAGSRAGLRP